MNTHSTSFEENFTFESTLFSTGSEDSPKMNTNGGDPIQKLKRALYALAFLLMLLFVLSTRMAQAQVAADMEIRTKLCNHPGNVPHAQGGNYQKISFLLIVM